MEREDPSESEEKEEKQPTQESGWNWMLLCFFIVAFMFVISLREQNKPAPKENPPTKTENQIIAAKDAPKNDCDAFYEKAKDSAEYLPEVSIAHSLLYQNCQARKNKFLKTP